MTLMSDLFGSLCKINRIRHLFTKENLLVILSKLFYCSTVWAATSNQNINKLISYNFCIISQPEF